MGAPGEGALWGNGATLLASRTPLHKCHGQAPHQPPCLDAALRTALPCPPLPEQKRIYFSYCMPDQHQVLVGGAFPEGR